MQKKSVEQGILLLIKKAETELPNDVLAALKKAVKKEHGVAKIQLETMLKAAQVARKTGVPLCQDTGIQTFFVEIGKDFPFPSMIPTWIKHAVDKATNEIPIRPNAVDPISGKNNGSNSGDKLPHIIYDFTNGSKAWITALPKGSGSENMSRLWMLSPNTSLESIQKMIVDEIRAAGGRPCPPTILGIGIGGSADLCIQLAKHALLRSVGVRHTDKVLAGLEKKLIQQCNQTGIGPMGLGGKTTVLDVHIETASRHPASMPVGLVMQCWANRHATMTIDVDGVWRIV